MTGQWPEKSGWLEGSPGALRQRHTDALPNGLPPPRPSGAPAGFERLWSENATSVFGPAVPGIHNP
jgi:hypothetical protein